MEHEMDQCPVHSLVDVVPLYTHGDIGTEPESKALEIPLNPRSCTSGHEL